jgi:membrane-associated protease RseP (regulator of RpoE activity)
MSFYIYDITFLVLFTLFVIHFLYKRRTKLEKEGIMYLYRTQVGVRFIDYIGTKYKKTLRVLSVFAVISGYFLMATMMYFLGRLLYIYLFVPEIVRAIKIPPLMPLVPYLPEVFKIDFLPSFYFTYWIIAIAVIAVFHEFAHGIIARTYGIKIKTTGFGFLGPFLAAFVEPDEKQMESKSKFQQIAVLSAGTFTNLVLAILFFLLLALFFIVTFVPSGAMFNVYASQPIEINSITDIGRTPITNPTTGNIIDIINNNNLSDNLILGSNGNTLELTKITANNKSYYMTIDILKNQLIQDTDFVFLYLDTSAIKTGLKGSIIKLDNHQINTHEDLSNTLKNYKPEDTIQITTRIGKETFQYDIELIEHPEDSTKPMIGIGYSSQEGSMTSTITDFFNFFREPATDYQPRFNVDLIEFIYDLIWWLALINLSVALVNMWPVAIFDGGRMFMLTVWAITGSEKLGEIAFKTMTYLILGSLLLLMLGWVWAIF